MRHLPTTSYSGFTIVLSKPSRFDTTHLLSGNAGSWVDSSIASTGLTRYGCDIRTLDTLGEGLLPNTRAVLLLGIEALDKFKHDEFLLLTQQRGAPFVIDGITYIASFDAQDCYDRYDYFKDDESEEVKQDDKDNEKSNKGTTQRKNWRFWLRNDIKKSCRIAQHGTTVCEPNYHLWPDLKEVVDILTTTKGKHLYFDIETDSNLQMTCFGFSFNADDIYIVPMWQTDRPNKEYYYGQDTVFLLRALGVALRDNITVIHNAMFDLFVLAWRYGISLEGRVYDTMLSHTRCFIEVEKSLGHCISLYTDLPYHKNDGVFEPHNHHQTQQLYEYNGKDVYALTQIKPKIDEQAVRLNATESIQQVNSMVIPYLTIMLQGMNVDMARIINITSEGERRKIQLKRILTILTNGLDFNPNSHQQVSKYLYANTFKNAETGRTYRIPKPKEDPTNEKTLLQLLLKHNLPTIPIILSYRQVGKRISKCRFRLYSGLHWGKDISSSDTRFTTSYNLGRTTTMRLGSRKLLRRWGDNAQNFEEELRSIVVPDKGKMLVQADQSGAEALIVAYLCRDGQYRDIFKCGINPHCFLGLHLFYEQFGAELGYDLKGYTQLPAKDLVKESRWEEIGKCIKASDGWPIRYYFVAKQGNHSLNYDARARMFRLNTLLKSEGTVAMSMEEAEKVIRTRSNLFPEIHQWHNDVVTDIRTKGLIRNLFGHPRVLTGHLDESQYKEYYAFPPQSTVGQITNYAITEIHEQQVEGIDILANTHDGALLQCYPEQKELAGRMLQKAFNRELVSPRGERFSMKSDLKWSETNWKEMIPLKLT